MRYRFIISCLLSAVTVFALNAPFSSAAQVASPQQSSPQLCPMVSVVSGPNQPVPKDGPYTYTLDPGPFTNNPAYKCIWTISDQAGPAGECKKTTQTFDAKADAVTVQLEVQDAQSGKTTCVTNPDQNTFKAGDKRAAISPQLEVNYPVLKGPNGTKITLTPLTTPAEYVRYAFFLSLTLLGAVAFLSLFAAGAQWLMSGPGSEGAGKARKRAFNVFAGMFLLLGSYLILSYINPELVKPRNPKLPAINIKIPDINIAALKMCQEKQAVTCTDYSSFGFDTCIYNACGSKNQEGPCNWGSGGCYSARDACPKVKSCEDYPAQFPNSDIDSACRHDICGVGPCEFHGVWLTIFHKGSCKSQQ